MRLAKEKGTEETFMRDDNMMKYEKTLPRFDSYYAVKSSFPNMASKRNLNLRTVMEKNETIKNLLVVVQEGYLAKLTQVSAKLHK